jgi:hypothetical protein
MDTRAVSRRDYEQDVLSAFARLAGRRAPGICDDALGHEHRAQRIFYDALARFRDEVRETGTLTDLRRDALADLLAGLDDTTPDRKAWDEAIAEARNNG